MEYATDLEDIIPFCRNIRVFVATTRIERERFFWNGGVSYRTFASSKDNDRKNNKYKNKKKIKTQNDYEDKKEFG